MARARTFCLHLRLQQLRHDLVLCLHVCVWVLVRFLVLLVLGIDRGEWAN